jgi:hypothetical protein
MALQAGGARAMAMGSAYVGVAEGSSALLWNPAGLAELPAPEAAIHHLSGLLGSIQEIVVLGMPLGSSAGFGASFNYMDRGVFEQRDESGALTGDYRANDFGGSVGLAFSASGLSVGGALKGNSQRMAGSQMNALSGDLGLLWNPISTLNLGVAYAGLGGQVAGADLSTALRAGISGVLGVGRNFELLFALAGEARNGGGMDRLQVGAEALFSSMVALRAGYQARLGGASVEGAEGLSLGAGFSARNLSLDYAFLPMATELGAQHRVSLSFRFLAAAASPGPLAAAETGRPQQERVLVLTDAYFINSAPEQEQALSPQGRAALDPYLPELQSGVPQMLRIEGRSNESLPEAEMEQLARLRSGLVRDYLVARGVPPSSVTSTGYSSLSPSSSGLEPDRLLFQVVVR